MSTPFCCLSGRHVQCRLNAASNTCIDSEVACRGPHREFDGALEAVGAPLRQVPQTQLHAGSESDPIEDAALLGRSGVLGLQSPVVPIGT